MSWNIITLNRGDTFKFTLSIEDESAENGYYILRNDDAVYLGIMDPHQMFENALIKKKYTAEDIDEAGNLLIEITSEDTLDLFPGIYYYTIKLHKSSPATEDEAEIDEVSTIINKTKLIIND